MRLHVVGGGSVRLAPDGPTKLIIEALGVDLWLSMPTHFGYGIMERPQRVKVMSSQAHNYTAIALAEGEAELLGPEEVLSTGHQRQRGSDIRIHSADGRIRLSMDISEVEQDPRRIAPAVGDLERASQRVQAEWERFASDIPTIPTARAGLAKLAWWTLWSAFVRAEGSFANDACLMSKRFMCKVWSWDHCFNALALVDTRPEMALQQFLLPFHLQAPSGGLPDCFSPNSEVIWAVSKPPVHGWAFSQMLSRHNWPRAVLERVYGYLARWSEYYSIYRDSDQDGVPEVPMGCDSQDNGAAFLGSFFVASPDVTGYLALQQDCLAILADKLGWTDQSRLWRDRSRATVQALIYRLWDGNEFFCRATATGIRLPERDASALIMPLVLGNLMPTDIFTATVNRLESGFLGKYGVASQAFSSPLYQDDGYWLGIVWAPLQLLLADGLERGGRADVSRRIATGFLDACEQSGGYYEGYDAKTGQGLRAEGYTWTAAVALELARRWG